MRFFLGGPFFLLLCPLLHSAVARSTSTGRDFTASPLASVTLKQQLTLNRILHKHGESGIRAKTALSVNNLPFEESIRPSLENQHGFARETAQTLTGGAIL